jgi:methyl-accepting chemotaxis protein
MRREDFMGNIGLRPKILVLLSFPLLGLAFLTSQIALQRWSVAEESLDLVTLTQLSVRIGHLLHETQKERGSSSLFMSSQGTKFGDKLEAQQRLTDEQLRAFRTFAAANASTLPSEVGTLLQKATATLGELTAKREAVATLAVKPKEIIDWYTQLNNELLDSVGSIASKGSNAELGRLSIAYVAFLHAKEETGLERAQLSNVFGTNQFGPGQAFTVAGLIGAQRSYLQVFSSLADPAIVEAYRERMADPEVAEVARMEQIAREKVGVGQFEVDSTEWFAAATAKIDLLKEVENVLSTAIVDRATTIATGAYQSLRVTATVLLALFAGVLTLALIMARSIVNPVRALTTIADKVSMGDVKQDVNVDASGEIGELASSFKRMVNAFKVMNAMLNAEPAGHRE